MVQLLRDYTSFSRISGTKCFCFCKHSLETLWSRNKPTKMHFSRWLMSEAYLQSRHVVCNHPNIQQKRLLCREKIFCFIVICLQVFPQTWLQLKHPMFLSVYLSFPQVTLPQWSSICPSSLHIPYVCIFLWWELLLFNSELIVFHLSVLLSSCILLLPIPLSHSSKTIPISHLIHLKQHKSH